MVDVLWERRPLVMFAIDLTAGGTEIAIDLTAGGIEIKNKRVEPLSQNGGPPCNIS
ncbi:MAG: hypothetical protein LAP61_26560 [Acidobacteriia bacterium]|nr:hypothetical protein [Terriglobia bacterium]